jgi:hypothetical protein
MERRESARPETNGAAWTPRQARLAAALAAGLSVKAAAARCKIGLRTAFTYQADPAFRAEVARLRDDVLARTIGRLTRGSTTAARALLVLVRSEDETVRLRAALGILDRLITTREHGELSARIAALEEKSRAHRIKTQPARNGRRRLER